MSVKHTTKYCILKHIQPTVKFHSRNYVTIKINCMGRLTAKFYKDQNTKYPTQKHTGILMTTIMRCIMRPVLATHRDKYLVSNESLP